MIDAHHHLWNYNDRDYVWMSAEMGVLRRDYLLPDLETAAAGCGLSGTVVVQACQRLEETEWLLGLAQPSRLIRGVVGWVPLIEHDVVASIERFAANPKLRGLRHILHDEPDDFYMLRPDFLRGVGLLRDFDLAYDILVFERHLPQTIQFVDRFPDQVFVLDHIAKPRIRDGELSPWRERIVELARRENVYCKLSGMVTESAWNGWTPAQLKPYFDTVLQAFGTRRLMFGSDWPVMTLASSYRTWVETVGNWVLPLSETERVDLWESTAVRAYGL